MAIRAKVNTSGALLLTYEHASMPTFTKWDRVKFGAGDELLAAVTGPDADSFGFVQEQNGTEVTVLADGTALIPVKVGTSQTATRGKYAVMHSSANTYKDATAPGGGTTNQVIHGRFMQSGTGDDIVTMMVGGINQATVVA